MSKKLHSNQLARKAANHAYYVLKFFDYLLQEPIPAFAARSALDLKFQLPSNRLQWWWNKFKGDAGSDDPLQPLRLFAHYGKQFDSILEMTGSAHFELACWSQALLQVVAGENSQLAWCYGVCQQLDPSWGPWDPLLHEDMQAAVLLLDSSIDRALEPYRVTKAGFVARLVAEHKQLHKSQEPPIYSKAYDLKAHVSNHPFTRKVVSMIVRAQHSVERSAFAEALKTSKRSESALTRALTRYLADAVEADYLVKVSHGRYELGPEGKLFASLLK